MFNYYIYKKIELVGLFKISIEDVINNVFVEVVKSIQYLEWFEVVDICGYIENGVVGYYQVILKVGFCIVNS